MASVQGSDNAGSTQEQLQLLQKRIESLEGTILSMQAVERLLEHRIVSLEKLEHRILSLEKKVNNDPVYVSDVREVKSSKETKTISFIAHQDLSVPKTHNVRNTPSNTLNPANLIDDTQGKTLHARALSSTIPSSSNLSTDNPSPRRTGHQSDVVRATPPDCLLDDEKQHVCDAPVLTPNRAVGILLSFCDISF
jgi:TolA-binding protein